MVLAGTADEHKLHRPAVHMHTMDKIQAECLWGALSERVVLVNVGLWQALQAASVCASPDALS